MNRSNELQSHLAAALAPFIRNDNIAGFCEYLADRTGSKVVIIEDLSAAACCSEDPAGSIVLIPDGVRALRDIPYLSQTLQTLAEAAHKVVLVDDIDAFQDASEYKDILSASSLPLEITGYNKDFYGESIYLSILSHALPWQSQPTPDDFRVVALISTFNELDVIEPVIHRLSQNGIDLYILDNWSTDGTFEALQQMQDRRIIGIERWPSSGPVDTYDWTGILKRKAAMAHEIDASWFIHHDADEIRESPWENLNLRDAIYFVDQMGYSAIDFTVLDFQPVDNGYPAGSSLEEYFKYFKFGVQSADFLQVKSWKNTRETVDLISTAGHTVEFASRKVFPYKFLLKHFPIRSQDHGMKKILNERISRWSTHERNLGWHTHYEAYHAESRFLKNPKGLLSFNADFYNDFVLERISGIGIHTAAMKIELLQSRVQSVEADNAALKNELAGLEDEVLSHVLSTSWKITRPFRRLRKLLSKK